MARQLQEVSCLQAQAVDNLQLHQHADGSDALAFDSIDVGGGCSIGACASNDNIVLTWSFSRAAPSELQLTETHVEGQEVSYKRTVAFGTRLFPKACFHSTHGVIVLTADGLLHSLVPSDQSSKACLLKRLATSSVNLKQEIQKLSGPTTLSLIKASPSQQDSICVGGQSGSILVVPVTCLDGNTTSGCHELHHTPSSYLGFFSRTVTPAVAWTGSLLPFAPDILCALHADCILRFWNATNQQRVLVETLLQQSGQKGQLVPVSVGSVCSTQGHLRLIVHMMPKTGSSHHPQTHAVSMDLQRLQDGQLQALNMRERMLEESDLRVKAVLSESSNADTDSAQTWLLSDSPALHAITSNVSGRQHEQSAILIERQGSFHESTHQPLENNLWQTIQHNIHEATGRQLPDDIIVRYHMQQLLAPGALCQQALSHALLEMEEPLSRYNDSLQQVQRHLTAAAQGIVAREKCSELSSWRQVVQTYWKHWTELHPPVGLVELPQGGVAVVRGGHLVTLLLQTDSGIASATNDNPSSQDVQLLHTCNQLLSQLLGPSLTQLLVYLCSQLPQDISLQSICNAAVEALSTGPLPSSSQQTLESPDRRDALRFWRHQRSAAILKLGELVSRMTAGTPVQALRDYTASLTSLANGSPSQPDLASSVLTPKAGEALSITLRQAANSQLQSASQLLLIAWLDSLRAAEAVHITTAASAALQQEMAPQLQAHSCSMAILQWLCTAPAAALPDSEAARLKHLQLSSQLASLDFASGSKHEARHQQSLAELLLPDITAQYGGISLLHEPHKAIQALAQFLQLGCTHTTAPSQLSLSTVVQRVLALGQKLIELHQVAHIPQLLLLAGEAAACAGGDFLRGYAGLHQAQHCASQELAGHAVQTAVGQLFQAAAVFHSASHPAQYGQQADLAASCTMVKAVVHHILTALTGSCDSAPPQEQELQYFEALMLQSEHWGWPEAAASFAQAALRHLHTVYDDANAPQLQQDRAAWAVQRHSRESMLYTNLFVYALEAGQYEDAYLALQANPTAQDALGNLQRLVNTLLNTSNIATLCSLPFATDHTIQAGNGRHEVVSLLEPTQHLLEQRALAAELSSHPQPYDVLYDFHCMRGNYKAAAIAQYRLACRLQREGSCTLHCLQHRAAALLQALTALSMVDPTQQWLLDPEPLQQALQSPTPYTQNPSAASLNPQRPALVSACTGGIAGSIVVLCGSSSQAVGSGKRYRDLTKLHAAAHAHVLLAQLDPGAVQRPTDADDVFHQALALGLFQVALSLAVVQWEGRRLSQRLEAVIAAMVTACVQKQLDTSDVASGPAFTSSCSQGQALQAFSEEEEVVPDFQDLSAAAAWARVMDTLQRHAPGQQQGLYLAALRAALQQERRLKLPPPLLVPFQAPSPLDSLSGMAGAGADPAALLAIYLQFDRLTDAADLVLDYLDAYQKADVTSRQGHCRVWFPFRLIIDLMTKLRRSQKFARKYAQLQQALQRHQESAMNMSHMFQSKFDLLDEAAIMEE